MSVAIGRFDRMELSDLVQPDAGRVNTQVYVDQEIFEQEVRHIWRRSWLYAGHVSEVPTIGDYVTRTVGLVPVIISHSSEDEVKVLVNSCRHRGNTVCVWDHGNSRLFRCAYHHWTYGSDGRLIGVPYAQNYGPDFDKSVLGLDEVPRVDTYRGFIFISHSLEGPSLLEHLDRTTESLDWAADLSPTGHLDFNAGYNSMDIGANWKMYMENAADQYHAELLHESAINEINEPLGVLLRKLSRSESSAVFRDLGHGHAFGDFAPEYAQGEKPVTGNTRKVSETAQATYEDDLVDRVGRERADELLRTGTPLCYIFPNMMLNQQDVRRIEPVSAMRSRLYQHPFLYAGAPGEVNSQRLRRHESAYGPAGLVMSDDIEIFERCQNALQRDADRWLLLRRGIHREEFDAHGNRYSHVGDETALRGLWRGYLEAMSG